MAGKLSKKRKLQPDADSDSEDAPRLEEWQSSEDEGSSDDEAENRKERLMQKGVAGSLPIARVLCHKGAKAYAIIVDLGSGLEGFLPLKELVEDRHMRTLIATRLGTMKDSTAPVQGRLDRRPRVHRVLVKGDARGTKQLELSGKGEEVAASLNESWEALSEPCRAMLRRLYDRDRAGELTNLSGLAIGLLLEGVVEQRANEGAVLSLSNPWNPRQRNLLGVAVGANAQLPASNSFPAPPSPALSSTPGTPGSVASDYSVSKLRPGCLRCRILDFDPSSGFVDVACSAPVVNNQCAIDKKVALANYRSLKKKIGKSIPVQVILKKKDYAIVISRPFSGVLGYLALDGDPKAATVRAGEKYTAKIEYVRVKPQPVKEKLPKSRTPTTTPTGGRTLLDDDEKVALQRQGEEQQQEKPQRSKSRTRTIVSIDPWICSESFAVLTLDWAANRAAKADGKTHAAQPNSDSKAPPSLLDTALAVGQEAVAAGAPAAAGKPAGEKKPAAKKSAIEVGFSFREDPAADDGSDDAGPGGAGGEAKKKKRRKITAEDNELAIDEMERARLHSNEPKTVQDFDRLVMASPHSSYVWAQYMAFHMSQREYEQARLIAERALKAINYRETAELHNVWVAYLNLENLHGTRESMNEVFKRFVQHSDQPEKAYEALVEIGTASNHHVLVDKTFQTMLKRFGSSDIKPWVDYSQYLITRGHQDDVNKLQKRMLNNPALTDKQRVAALLKIGCLQYRQGSVDKGRTIFEGLLVKYPKRTDLWVVYLDMEQVVLPRLGDPARIRHVFDRATSMNLSSKTMQYFMTRYLTFERENGSADRVEYVKQRAIAFVNAKLGEGTDETAG
ncbi:rRNA biogenesis protein RRP5 [Diplonema papillatum]|nr:rRNA biogenesis protein RRP5 [Diplonema papillatum]